MRVLAWVMVSLQQTAAVGLVTVDVSGLRTTRGQVGCMVFRTSAGFPMEPSKADARCFSGITDGGARCDFDAVPPGAVAVACFHDENGNGVLDRGVFGIPREGWVVSREAKGRFGPPDFDAARVVHDGGVTRLSLPVGY